MGKLFFLKLMAGLVTLSMSGLAFGAEQKFDSVEEECLENYQEILDSGLKLGLVFGTQKIIRHTEGPHLRMKGFKISGVLKVRHSSCMTLTHGRTNLYLQSHARFEFAGKSYAVSLVNPESQVVPVIKGTKSRLGFFSTKISGISAFVHQIAIASMLKEKGFDSFEPAGSSSYFNLLKTPITEDLILPTSSVYNSLVGTVSHESEYRMLTLQRYDLLKP